MLDMNQGNDYMRPTVPGAPAVASVEPALPGPGERIGQYEIIRELGRGGMGVVYVARDTRLSRRVAIKLTQSQRPRPYAGLGAFQEADAGRFFGRTRHIAAACTRLRDEHRMVRARLYGVQVEQTNEELARKNQELGQALVHATEARQRADASATAAEQARAETLRANEQLRRSLDRERERVRRLENQGGTMVREVPRRPGAGEDMP